LICFCMFSCFFFSSRRRHTRSKRDWSSDVCSSDLLRKLEKELNNHGFNGQFHMMLSGGGTCTIDTACRFPIRILESGPIGGGMAASFYSELCNLSNLLVFDMGGTTAKASLVDNGVPLVTNEFE